MPHLPAIEILAVFVVLLAAITDVRTRRIPNWLTLSAACAGLMVNALQYGVHGLITSAEGLALGFGAYMALYLLRAMGAGDVKLMGAIGAIVGLQHWVFIFIASSIAGGIFAVVLMVRSGRARQTVLNSIFIVGELVALRAPYERRSDLDVKNPDTLRLPHGLAIAAGTLTCLALQLI